MLCVNVLNKQPYEKDRSCLNKFKYIYELREISWIRWNALGTTVGNGKSNNVMKGTLVKEPIPKTYRNDPSTSK